MRVFSFERYIFRMKFLLALHIEIYTVSRGFLATARLFLAYPIFMRYRVAWLQMS